MAKVLVIDDQPEILALFAEVLTGDGHQVITAADGASGLVLHGRHHPNLVITDLDAWTSRARDHCPAPRRTWSEAHRHVGEQP